MEALQTPSEDRVHRKPWLQVFSVMDAADFCYRLKTKN